MCSGSEASSVPVHATAAKASVAKRPAGVSSLTADTPAAPAPSCLSKIEKARHQADFTRRFAYSELDQHVRRTIASADWCCLSDPRVCKKIGQAFHIYRTTSEFAREPVDPKAVVAELRLTLEYFSQMNLWPRWVQHPNEWVVRRLPEYYAAYEDFGDENWEALVNLMNLSSVIPSVYSEEIFNAPGSAVYGDRVRKSGFASHNFRGNGVERMLTYLLFQCEEEALAVLSPDAPI